MYKLTAEERELIKKILTVLNEMDGGQVAEVHLHAQVNLRLQRNAPLAVFTDALEKADGYGWVVGVPGKFGGGRLWTISDSGQAARLELR